MKYFKIKISFIILLTFVVSGCGIISNKTNKPTSILWEVRPKSDTSKVVYLLGSIHIAPPELYPLNPAIMAAWDKSNALAVEMNILDGESMRDMSLIAKIISFTDKLSDKLPENLYTKIKNTFIKKGILEEMIDYLTPLGASMLLQLGDAAQLMFDDKDSNSVDGIDMYFLKKAEEEDKPIYEVESLNIQIEALETLNENIIPYLQTLVDDLDNVNTDISKLFAAWKNGDVKTIEEIMNTSFAVDKAVNDKIANALLYNRNIDMAAKIENYLKEKETYFVVLGAGHYVGEKSIIDILNKSGKYNIKRL